MEHFIHVTCSMFCTSTKVIQYTSPFVFHSCRLGLRYNFKETSHNINNLFKASREAAGEARPGEALQQLCGGLGGRTEGT